VPDAMLHVASAVVKARPAAQDAVAREIAALAGADVLAVDHGRIIVVLEASCHHDLAGNLDRIAVLDGALSAVLVFEHAEPEGDPT
jgi:nitrate reductase NapAB chaperone NapD